MIGVKVETIIVPENRFRRNFDEKAMRELESSIERLGLLQFPTVEKGEDGNWILRAGERRLRACKKLIDSGKQIQVGDIQFPLGHIPANDYTQLSELHRLEIEVEENVVRADFTWQERTKALAKLHELRKLQNPGQTIADTASEVLGKPAVGDQRMVVSNAVIVSKHLDDPEVAKAKSERDALKIIAKKTAREHQAKLAVTFDRTRTNHKVIHGDSKEVLAGIAEASFDVICSDPPYGIGADSFGDMADQGHDYNDTAREVESLYSWLPDELFRVAKPAAHCYLFCDQRWFERLSVLMVLAGWRVFPTMLIWDKCGTGMLPFPENGPRRTYETILYAWKGNRRTLTVKNDVIRCSAVKALKHGAQKPVALYSELLARSANPGDSVLDCFGGSGPILVAANRLRLVATYIEKDEASYNIALSRSDQMLIDDGAEEDDGITL